MVLEVLDDELDSGIFTACSDCDSRGPVEQKMNRLLELLQAVPVLIAIYMTTKWMRR